MFSDSRNSLMKRLELFPPPLVGTSVIEKLDFFLADLYEHLVTETINYASRTNPEFDVTVGEMKRVLGILLLSGYHPLPSVRHYWSTDDDLQCPLVSNAMSRNRFEEILRFIHCADNDTLDLSDRMAKLRPVMDLLNKRFSDGYPMDCSIDLDEAMIEYFGRHGCKQAIRNKPVRFGFKAWCLNSGTTGYLLRFDIYQGSSGTTSTTEAKFGKGGGTLIRLLDETPPEIRALPLRIYIDNYFTGLPLLVEMRERGYACTGTIRDNRIPKSCTIEDKNKMKKKERGAFDVVYDAKNKIAVTRWKDNAVVTVASTISADKPLLKATRWSAKEKKRVSVPQPNVINLYNRGMGGTDRADQSIGAYRINVRRKKWWWSILTWMLDASVVNAWILHRLDSHSEIPLLAFRREVSRHLIASPALPRSRGIGRPRHCTISDNARFDEMSHWPVGIKQGRKCGIDACTSRPSSGCSKCKVALCLKCFMAYHIPNV